LSAIILGDIDDHYFPQQYIYNKTDLRNVFPVKFYPKMTYYITPFPFKKKQSKFNMADFKMAAMNNIRSSR